MRLLLMVLLACLLLAASVSAITVGSGSAGLQNPVVTVATPYTVPAHGALVPVTVATTTGEYAPLYVDTNPDGASVTIDGHTYPARTPAYFTAIPTGFHTVVLSLNGYLDYTTSLTLKLEAHAQVINVSLTKKMPAAVVHAAIAEVQSTAVTPVPAPAPWPSLPGSGFITTSPTGGTRVPLQQGIPGAAIATIVTTPVPVDCPNTDWSCLTPMMAAMKFGDSKARWSSQPCGYAVAPDRTVWMYCYQDVPDGGMLPAGELRKAGIRINDSIYIENASWIQHMVVAASPAGSGTGSAGGENAGPLQRVFDFFNSLLGGRPNADNYLQFVELNPQPEPPLPADAGRLK